MIAYLLSLLVQLQAQLKKLIVDKNVQTEATKKLHITALAWKGKDVTPLDDKVPSGVPDDVACVEVLNQLCKMAWGEPAGGGNSTYLLYYALKDSKKFVEVTNPLPGDIILSPSGFGDPASLVKSGHTGVVTNDNKILSNISYGIDAGKLGDVYDLWSWQYKWGKAGFPIKYYRRLMV
ncbi:MAG: hypothetical protein AAB456_00915 [Patescibacteria group bacterium]